MDPNASVGTNNLMNHKLWSKLSIRTLETLSPKPVVGQTCCRTNNGSEAHWAVRSDFQLQIVVSAINSDDGTQFERWKHWTSGYKLNFWRNSTVPFLSSSFSHLITSFRHRTAVLLTAYKKTSLDRALSWITYLGQSSGLETIRMIILISKN